MRALGDGDLSASLKLVVRSLIFSFLRASASPRETFFGQWGPDRSQGGVCANGVPGASFRGAAICINREKNRENRQTRDGIGGIGWGKVLILLGDLSDFPTVLNRELFWPYQGIKCPGTGKG